MGFKYIIVKKGNRELPFIFPDECVHAHMFKCVRAMTKMEVRQVAPMLSKEKLEAIADELEVVGAGSITFDVGSATGSSETLGITSRPTDAAYIQRFPYTHGILDDDA